MIPDKSIHADADLAATYEKGLRDEAGPRAKSKRAREGIFYTPASVASYVLRRAFLVWQSEKNVNCPTILDPSCGGGVFLIEAAKLLRESFRTAVIFENLYGVDKDSHALKICKENLKTSIQNFTASDETFGIEESLTNNFKLGNALLSPEDLSADIKKLPAIDWKSSFAKVQSGFDIIVGNPPYGISRDEKFDPHEKRILEEKFNWVRSGKLNKYIAFIGKAYDLLAPGGVCAMIVPNSWLGIKSGENLRKFLLSKGALTELHVFKEALFEDPSVESVIVVFQKEHPRSSFSLIRSLKPLPLAISRAQKISHASCLRLPTFLIPTFWSTEAENILLKIFSNSIQLGDASSPYRPRIALQAYAKGKGTPPQTASDIKNRVYDRIAKEDKDSYPYLNGDNIKRFGINWSGSYLKHGPWLADPQPIERYFGPRLILREIIAPPPYLLVGSYTDETFLYNKSVLHILPKNSEVTPIMLKALLGLLLSLTASFVVQFTGRKSQRKLFPKIVNGDLTSFPLPNLLDKFQLEIAEVVSELLKNAQKDPNSELTKSHLQEELDRLTAKAYGLEENQGHILLELIHSANSFS